MRVVYVPTVNCFLISLQNGYEATIIRDAPMRQYNAKTAKWILQGTQNNALWLKRLIDTKQAHVDLINGAEAKMMDLVNNRVVSDPFPEDFEFKKPPRKHQKEALDKIGSLQNAMIFHAPGTGKTKTSLDRNAALALQDKIDSLFIVCPNSVRRQWKRELLNHFTPSIPESDLHIYVLEKVSLDKVTKQLLKTKSTGLNIYIIGTESLQGTVQGSQALSVTTLLMKAYTRPGLIVDEAHYLKNHESNRTGAVCSLAKYCAFKLLMTGTPISNASPEDLFSYFYILDPKIIGIPSYYSFRARYCHTVTFEVEDKKRSTEEHKVYRKITKVDGGKNMEELMHIILPFVHVAGKEVLENLPGQVFFTRFVKMHPMQRMEYNFVKKNNILKLSPSEAIVGNSQILKNALIKLQKLHQIAQGFFIYSEIDDKLMTETKKIREIIEPTKNPKFLELSSILEEIGPDTKALVWVRFKYELRYLAKYLDEVGIPYVIYSSDLDDSGKEAIKNRFVNEPGIRLFISTAESGGTGTDGLQTVCSHTIFLSNQYRFTLRKQTEDRTHRDGQTKASIYYEIIAEETVDELILESLQNKKDVSEWVMERLTDIQTQDTWKTKEVELLFEGERNIQ